jgi:hypothetical protein
MPSVQAIADFTSIVGLLTLFVASYGTLRRRLPGTRLAPQLLGLLFGAAAACQMKLSGVPPGVAADPRIVPVVLAGAFLGLRGMVIAAGIATAMRLSIGGIGTASGVAAIWSAGGLGLLWSYATIGPARRGRGSLVALGGVACLTLASAALLPEDAGLRFLVEAGPGLAATYLLVVPALAALLERQRVAMQREAWLRAAAASRADPDLAGPEALTLALARAEGSGRFRDGVDMLVLHVRSARFALSLWGAEVEVAVLRALRTRIRAALPHGAEMGMGTHGELLVFLERGPAGAAEREMTRLCAIASTERYRVPGMASVRLVVTGRATGFAHLPRWSEVVRAFEPGARGSASRPAIPSGETVARLFDATERLFEASAAERAAAPALRRR